jgi:hypothetical protein
MSKLKRRFELLLFGARLKRTLVAQGDGDGGKRERVGDGKHGVAGATGQDAELEGGGEHLGAWGQRGEGRGMVGRGDGGGGGEMLGASGFDVRRITLRMLEISTKSAAPKASSNTMCCALTAGGTCRT